MIYEYQHQGQRFEGFLATPKHEGEYPGVLIIHDWSGRNTFADEKAQKIADLGYVGFAVDLYGDGKTGQTTEEKSALMQPLASNRALIRSHLATALAELRRMPMVNPHKIAIMGFCFGGLCSLELARSGADILGTISFHGLLHADPALPTHPIHSKILVLHGYDDPMVPPSTLMHFATEMTQAKADWQIHAYGNTKHAFTNPLAHDQQLGLIYNENANHRSWQALVNFLKEIFSE